MLKVVALLSVVAAALAQPATLLAYGYGGYGGYGYLAPAYSYAGGAPLLSTGYSASLLASSPLLTTPPLAYSAPAHFIKKRSVGLLPASYLAPSAYSYSYGAYPYAAAAGPFIASTYAAAPVSHAAPIAYSAHLIKKRSAPLLSTYIAPAAVSHQARIDYQTAAYPAAFSYPYGAPYSNPYAAAASYSYASPLAYSQYLYKK